MMRLYASGPTQTAALQALVDTLLTRGREADVNSLNCDCTLNADGQVVRWHLSVDSHRHEDTP